MALAFASHFPPVPECFHCFEPIPVGKGIEAHPSFCWKGCTDHVYCNESCYEAHNDRGKK